MGSLQQVYEDFDFVFARMPTSSLRHLQLNLHRLIRRAYTNESGEGCIFNLLTETQPACQRITSRESLTRYFGGDPEAPEYQPARWLVRYWDGDCCDEVYRRYGATERMDEEILFDALALAIEQREQAEMTLHPASSTEPATSTMAGVGLSS